jgi:hypothetical protein
MIIGKRIFATLRQTKGIIILAFFQLKKIFMSILIGIAEPPR